ncbi:uncharacterized protein LOC144036875 isoform X3 [Vanacampus margaritifer]
MSRFYHNRGGGGGMGMYQFNPRRGGGIGGPMRGGIMANQNFRNHPFQNQNRRGGNNDFNRGQQSSPQKPQNNQGVSGLPAPTPGPALTMKGPMDKLQEQEKATTPATEPKVQVKQEITSAQSNQNPQLKSPTQNASNPPQQQQQQQTQSTPVSPKSGPQQNQQNQKVGPQPNQQKVSPQPNQQKVGPQPNQQKVAPQPNQQKAGQQPNQQKAGQQPNQRVGQPQNQQNQRAGQPQNLQNQRAGQPQNLQSQRAGQPQNLQSQRAGQPQNLQNQRAGQPQNLQNQRAGQPQNLQNQRAGQPQNLQNQRAGQPQNLQNQRTGPQQNQRAGQPQNLQNQRTGPQQNQRAGMQQQNQQNQRIGQQHNQQNQRPGPKMGPQMNTTLHTPVQGQTQQQETPGTSSGESKLQQDLKATLSMLLKPGEKAYTQRCRLFIGNLPNDITEDNFRKIFAKYGEPSEVFINKGKGFGFIRLESRALAEIAKAELDDLPMKGRSLRVRFATHSAALSVKNLSPYVSNELLEEAFSQFGLVERAIVIVDDRGRSTGKGIVEFASKPAARKALDRCNEGVFLLTTSPRPILVEPLEQCDDEDGLPEKLAQKNHRYQSEREEPPRFARPGTFEFEYSKRWKSLDEMEKQQRQQVEKNMREAREKLESEMEDAYHEHQANLLRQDLMRRQEELRRMEELHSQEMQKRKEMQLRQEEERRRREEEMIRQREMEEQMRRQREESYRMGNYMDRERDMRMSAGGAMGMGDMSYGAVAQNFNLSGMGFEGQQSMGASPGSQMSNDLEPPLADGG